MASRQNGEDLLYDRFERIPGAVQQALAQAPVTVIGCGGLGGEVGHGLVRKGVGRLILCDHDQVDPSNLARQQFYAADVGQPKALALARNLARQATGPSVIEGHAYSFQAARDKGIKLDGQVAVVGVDNNTTRLEAAKYYLARGIPVIFLAVDVLAARGYVFVQTSQAGDPCFLCRFPDAPNDKRIHGCAGASIEILKIMAGIALYAIDSLLMHRPRPWNYKTVFLDRAGDGQSLVGRRPNCPLCREVDAMTQAEAPHG